MFLNFQCLNTSLDPCPSPHVTAEAPLKQRARALYFGEFVLFPVFFATTVVGFTGTIQIVKLVLRKQAASALPSSLSQPVSASSYGFSSGSARLLGSALPAWAPPSVREHFLAWGSNHVDKMGSVLRSAPHNSEIHRTKSWGGKSLTSLKHEILINTESDSGVYCFCFVFIFGRTTLVVAKDGDIIFFHQTWRLLSGLRE